MLMVTWVQLVRVDRLQRPARSMTKDPLSAHNRVDKNPIIKFRRICYYMSS
jgi:hypothetical protein